MKISNNKKKANEHFFPVKRKKMKEINGGP